MTFEWAAVSAVAAIGGFGVAFATFWLTFGREIASAKAEATAAKSEIGNLRAEHQKVDERVTLLAASFGMYREQVAKEYISREVAREMEDRITASVERLGTRLDRLVETIASK